jgi:preprotein translocase subunit SecD
MAPDGPPKPSAPTEPAPAPRVRPFVEPPPVRYRRSWLGVGIAAVLVVAVAAAGLVWWRTTRPPAGLVMTLDTRDPAPPAADLHKAADLLLDRLSAAGYPKPRVSVTGPRTVVATVGGGDPAGLMLLAQPGRLSFRAVVAGPTIPHVGAPSFAPASAPPAVVAKLGAAYPAARDLSDPGQVGPSALAALVPFGTLTPDEVAALPLAMQYAVPVVTCAQLNARKPGAIDDPAVPVVACERTGTESKYLLDPAAVTAADVAGAVVELQAVSGWTVTVRFTPAGQSRWTALTRAAVQNTPSNQIAIVVDNEVISAPTVQAVITGDAAISGAEIDREAARRLAAQLRSGPLPVTFAVSSIIRSR